MRRPYGKQRVPSRFKLDSRTNIRNLKSPPVRFGYVNSLSLAPAYGPAETTVWSTVALRNAAVCETVAEKGEARLREILPEQSKK